MRLINADALSNEMYHEAFEKDTDEQRWDSGCWIRYKMFERILKNQPTIGEWISVKDRLPEEGKFVLVTGNLYPNKHVGGTMAVSRRIDVTYWSGFGRTGNITHWMPLPEPPKEEDNENDQRMDH